MDSPTVSEMQSSRKRTTQVLTGKPTVMLEDTVQIVCGAGHGLGEETAVAMADNGATVVVNDLGVTVDGEGETAEPAQATVDRIEAAGGTAMAHFGDVTDLDYTESLVADTVEEYGAVHGLINFAGILRDSMVFNMSEAEWDAVIDVHLKGHFSLVRAISRHWRSRYKDQDGFDRQRSLTCVSSGVAAGNPGQANYSAAKAGILRIDANIGSRALPVRRSGQRPLAHRPDPDDRGSAGDGQCRRSKHGPAARARRTGLSCQ
ncbi:MAG: SDR family NAD(P)-dependent oxidoreductase [Natrialbaceae archaeon]|nr:SDR family NAD(P)-dependent oxidoreductase [Natrialbaceae archaeon]